MEGNLLETKRSALATLLLLSWPAIVEQLLLTAVNYVDSAMVGTLGAQATAAVSLISSTTWLLNGLFFAVGTGFSVQVAHAIGARDYSRARRVLRQSVLAVLVCGVAATAVVGGIARYIPVWLGAEAGVLAGAQAYAQIWSLSLLFVAGSNMFSSMLRGMGDTRTPLAVNTLTNLINVALNFLFIYPTRTVTAFGRSFTMWGAGLEVAGAALGTALALLCGSLMLAWSVFHRAEPFKIYLRDSYRPDRQIIRQTVRLGVPMALDRVIISAGQIFSTALIAGLGTVSLAAHHITVTAEGISYLPANGISFAATTLVGQSMGARRLDLAHRFASLAGKVGFALCVVSGTLLFFFSRPLASIFNSDAEVVALASAMLRIVAIALPLFGVSIVLGGALRGAGDVRPPFYFNMGGMWLVRLPLACCLLWFTDVGLAGVWMAMALDLSLRGIACILRLRSGRWKKLPPVPALGPAPREAEAGPPACTQ